MFPADWSWEKLLMKLIRHGTIKKAHPNSKKWEGVSKSGGGIEGYKEPKVTAFPRL
jgi:hypothetical protein